MESTTTNNQVKHQRRIPSDGEYREKVQWRIGEDIVTLVGGKVKEPIAFVTLDGYDENGKPIFSCRDFEGKTLFADNTTNLYQIKRDLKDKEIELETAFEKKQAQAREASEHITAPEKQKPKQEAPVQRPKAVRRSKSKEQDNEPSITH